MDLPDDVLVLTTDARSWLKVAHTGALAPGGVLLIYGSGAAFDSYVAGWYLAMAFAYQNTGDPVFTAAGLILPERLGKREVLRNIKALIEQQVLSLGWSKEEATSLLEALPTRKLETLEGTEITDALKHIRDGAAVGIPCVQMYRFPDIVAETPFGSTQSWLGTDYRWSTREQKYLPHLMELVRQALTIAQEKNLLVTLFCEEPEPVNRDLPSDLINHPALAVFSASVPLDNVSSSQSQVMISDLLQRMASGSIDSVQSYISEHVEEPDTRALLTSALLFADQKFIDAWAALEPHLDALINSDETTLLGMSQTALAAGQRDRSKEFLEAAVETGVTTLEELDAAHLQAKQLGLTSVQDQLFAQMLSAYPNSKPVLEIQYYRLCQIRDFSSARKIAELLHDEFAVHLCDAFSTSDFNLLGFFAYAKEVGKLNHAHLVAAYEAEYRKLDDLARQFAVSIESSSDYSSEAVEIRARILGRTIRGEQVIAKHEVEELRQLMQFVATHPGDLDVRFAVEDLLEAGLEEPAAAMVLSSMLINTLMVSFEANTSDGVRRFETLPQDSFDQSGNTDHEAFSHFWEAFLDSLPQDGFVVGLGEIDSSLKFLASPTLLHTLHVILEMTAHDIASDNDLQFLNKMIHAAILLNRELQEPSGDFIAIRIAIAAMAMAGYYQEARDMAETSLLMFSRILPIHANWRTGQAWACYADAFHRAGNLMAALRSLCFSFLSWDGPAQSQILLGSSFRLATRIFRDLGFTDFALQMVALERTWANRTGNEKALDQLKQVELSILMRDVMKDAQPERAIELLNQTAQLLDQAEDAEEEPLLSCQANLNRFLKMEGAVVPQQIEDQFYDRLRVLSERVSDTLRSVVNIAPTRNDLLHAVESAASADSLSDLAYQTQAIHNLATAAVVTACAESDIELFVLASTLLAQPALTLQTSNEPNNAAMLDYGKLYRWWAEEQRGMDAAKAEEAHRLVRAMASPQRKAFTQLAEISTDQIREVLRSDEGMIILVSDSGDRLCRAAIYPDGHQGLEQLGEEIWTPARYHKWRSGFPRAYGDWEPVRDPFTPEQPSIDGVRDSISGMALGDCKVPARIVIVPSANLFGFPFSLMLHGKTHLGEIAEVTTVPSGPWLIAARSEPWDGDPTKKAWLGSPLSDDLTLHFLRDRLTPSLEASQVEIVGTDFPEGMEHSKFALVVSHGNLGLRDRFRTVTDARTSFAPKEFAGALQGCGCVVLFVCNSGRSDPQIGSFETVGLVSELLRKNVRVVVAPPWPLNIYVTETWLPSFLHGLSAGHSVGHSAFEASQIVRQRFDNPCAWAALQIYGDASFKVDDQ